LTTLTKNQLAAAQEFANAAVATLKLPGGIHPGTVVAATARMAGTYLFRSFNLHLPGAEPGQAVLSIEANEQGPILIQIAAGILSQVGIKLDNTQAGKPTETKHKPTQPFLDTQRKLEPVYAPIKDRFGLSTQEAAHAAAVATALLIRHCAKVMDPNVAFGIAAYAFIEGAKTAPDPVQLPQGAAK
jgi:hypothetical protein